MKFEDLEINDLFFVDNYIFCKCTKTTGFSIYKRGYYLNCINREVEKVINISTNSDIHITLKGILITKKNTGDTDFIKYENIDKYFKKEII